MDTNPQNSFRACKRMRTTWAFRAIFALFLGLLFGGGTLMAPTLGPTSASGAPSTKAIVRAATLATSDQNMWGSGASAPTDVELVLFNETWNESGSGGDITGGCEEIAGVDVCAYFGASLTGSVSGEIGMSVALQGLGGGTLSVTYPVTVTFTAPADNSFDPGAAVDIKTSMVVDASNARIVASFPELDHIGLNGVFEIDASLTGQVCFFECSDPGNVFPPIHIGTNGELLGFDPGELNTCFTPGPLGFPWLLSTYTNARCGENGYFFNPDVEVASTFNAADGTISATGQDPYAILPVNVLPGGGTDLFLGAIGVNWTVFKAIITAVETIKQDLTFTPRVDVNLDWGKTLGYKVLNGANDNQLQSGNGTNATFKVGDTLRLTTNSLNNKVIPITPTLSMGSATMANNTRNSSATVARLEALAFHIITYDSDGEVDSDDGFGPIYEESFPVGTTEASIFNGTFNIGGFNSPVLEAFNIVPRPIVEVRKDVVPFNAPGNFNLKIDSDVLATNVGDGGSTGRVVVEPGTRTISETAGTATDLSFFDISISCVEYETGTVHTQTVGSAPGLGSSMNLNLTGGEDLLCTIRNRLPAPSECDVMTFDNVILGTPNSDKADRLNGTNQRDMIIGYGGDDIIDAGSGDDCVAGNAGNDQVGLGAGNDVGDGGTGNDNVGAGPGNDIVHGGDGIDEIAGGAGDDLVYGEGGNDTLTGGDGADEIYGGEGNDAITGSNGDDVLKGDGGTDVTNGSNGTDVCVGESKTNCEQ